MKRTPSPRSTLLWLALAALSMAIAACEGGATATPTPTPTLSSGPAPTPTQTVASSPTTAWNADLPTGGQNGQLAPNATVTLADGTTASLAEVADGKPLLLYFFATW